MQHVEEHAADAKKSIQTNGAGLLLLAIVATLIAIFCWNMWNDGGKAIDHYRIKKTETSTEHSEPAHH
jgi:predicted negative regulator of RcsB-dependent stress response